MSERRRRRLTFGERLRENGIRRTAVEIIGGRWYKERNEQITRILDDAFFTSTALTREFGVICGQRVPP